MGDRDFRPLMAALLADALIPQGKFVEAADLVAVAEQMAAPDDIVNVSAWQRVKAKVLAQRGETDAAITLAAKTCDLLSGTDMLDERALAALDLSAILKAAGLHERAAAAATEAAALYELKGNLVGRAKAEALLGSFDQGIGAQAGT